MRIGGNVKSLSFLLKTGIIVTGAIAAACAVASPVRTPSDVVTLAAEHPRVFRSSLGLLSMGTFVSGTICADSQQKADELSHLFEDSINEFSRLFTVHGTGPLKQVNEKAGKWVQTDCRIASLVRLACDIAHDSDRAFEPTIGPIVNAWKIGFGGTKVPSAAQLKDAVARVDYTRVETDMTPGACRVKIGKDQNIDLGGIAKGWIGTALIERMKANGATHVLADLGGNVALLGGAPAGDRDWRVGIQAPDADRGTPFAVVTAKDESVITSGNYERFMEAGGKRFGHILNAKTGESVKSDIGSVTIVDADGAKADGWCTALFAMGKEKALALLSLHPEVKAVIADESLANVWVSKSLVDRFSLIDEKIILNIIDQGQN